MQQIEALEEERDILQAELEDLYSDMEIELITSDANGYLVGEEVREVQIMVRLNEIEKELEKLRGEQ